MCVLLDVGHIYLVSRIFDFFCFFFVFQVVQEDGDMRQRPTKPEEVFILLIREGMNKFRSLVL